MRLIDLTNKRFGRLTVICRDVEYQKEKCADKPYWKCRCDCGEVLSVLGKSLREGKTKSCGCYQREITKSLNFNDLTGRKFEKLTVLKYMNKGKWECQCECGNTTIVSTSHLTSGHTQSCGCLHSKGERAIINFLNNKQIPFKKEYTSKELKNSEGNKLRIDFAILKDNKPILFIEYNGRQHYDVNDAWYSEKLHNHDILKKEYSKKTGIPLIVIRYDEDVEFVMSRIDFSKYNNV